MARALILTYHAVEAGRDPLCIEPALFAEHASVIAESQIQVLSISDLATELHQGPLEIDVVAITFDDGFTSVVEDALPVLAERGMTATLFCVAQYLGRVSDWPSARRGSYRSRLASASALGEASAAGFEIGSHGMEHAPLAVASEALMRREVVESRSSLEDSIGTRVSSYAYPYGALPGRTGRALVSQTYDAACSTLLGRVQGDTDVHALPRVDAHYLRHPELLHRMLNGGLGGYLRARRFASRARRTFAKDYRTHPVAVAQARPG